MIDAFYDLSSSRPVSDMGGEGAIPISEISAYCQLRGMRDPDDRLEFLELIRAIDYAFLDERRKRRENDATSEPGKSQ